MLILMIILGVVSVNRLGMMTYWWISCTKMLCRILLTQALPRWTHGNEFTTRKTATTWPPRTIKCWTKLKRKNNFWYWRFPSYDSVSIEVQKYFQEQGVFSYGQGLLNLIVRYKSLSKFDDYVCNKGLSSIRLKNIYKLFLKKLPIW